jgi:hypothetical protein
MSYSIVPSLIQDQIGRTTKFAGFASEFPLAFPCGRGCAKFLPGPAARRAKIAYVANFQGLSIYPPVNPAGALLDFREKKT